MKDTKFDRKGEIMCWHKYKWSEVKTEHLKQALISALYPEDVRGKFYDVTKWYQDAYCLKCNKYFSREIKK